jgi:subtilisin family serine protease
MRRQSVVIGLAAAAVAVAAVASTTLPEPVYVAGGSYTAVLDQHAKRWTLLPLDGQDFEIRANGASCAVTETIPSGVWLVGRDAQGRPELVAPSATLALAGQERVALHDCGEKGPGIAAPRPLIDWLASNTGAVYVED